MAALRARNVALTIGDHPKRPFQSYEATADWRFIRFHFGARGRVGNYSATELAEWAERIRPWQADGDLYIYFNNDWNSFAPANAALLRRRLGLVAYARGAAPQPETEARSTGRPTRSRKASSSRSSR